MNPTEHPQNTQSPPNFRVVRRWVFRSAGTGASTFALLAALTLCALALTAVPAFAAAPESPELTIEAPVHATTATFLGTLAPNATEPNEGGTYKFLYNASKTNVCTGGVETTPGISLGAPVEVLPAEPVAGLSAGTEYAVCLSVTNLKSETTVSPAVTFKTALPPEPPETSSPASSITATTATLEGTLNPVKAGDAGTYEIYYQQSPSECNPEHVAPEPAAAMSGAAKQGVSVPVTGLEPNTTYTFCLVATNAAGETTVGNAVPFKTAVSKPTVTSLSAPTPKAEEARLEATVNPSNEATECHFQYGTATVTEHTVSCEQGTPPGTLEGGEQGVAVNVTGLKPDTTYHYQVQLKNATGETTEASTFTTAIPPETPTGLKAEAITATTVTLTGTLNPKAAGNAGSYEFLYKNVADGAGCEREQSSGGEAHGHTPEPVEAKIENLIPDTTYAVCLRAHNEAGEESTLSAPVTFATPPLAPSIESESSNVVSATEARLEATINPGNGETSYQFEYGPAAGDYTSSIPSAGGHILPGVSGLEGKGVSAVATGLTPGTTYHYRAVATNAAATEHGPDQTFTTLAAQGPGSPTNCPNEHLRAEQPYGLALPDCRAYEMVSPLNTGGADVDISGLYARAAASGEAMTYASLNAFAEPTGNTFLTQYLSTRGAEGWSTQEITPLHHAFSTETGYSYEGMQFTPDLSEGIADTNDSLTGEAPEGEGVFGFYVDDFAKHSYRYVGYEEVSNDFVALVGASTDLTHVVHRNENPFQANTPEYGVFSEWVNGKVKLVSVTNAPGGQEGKQASPVGWRSVSADGSRVYYRLSSAEGLYLRDNAEQPQSPMKIVNGVEECEVSAEACTIEVSASQKTTGSGPKGADPNPGEAEYRGASVNGAKVFFTSSQELTNNANTGVSDLQKVVLGASGGTFTLTFKGQTTAPIAYDATSGELQSAFEALSSVGAGNVTVAGAPGAYVVTFGGALAGSEQPVIAADGSSLTAGGTIAVHVGERPGRDLYEYDVETGKLVDLSADSSDAAGAEVKGVAQISEDGSYVYFVADGNLASGATAGEPNLYVSHDGGAPTFIATLAANDSSAWAGGESGEAVLTPSGSQLAFTSELSLTGYDNEQAAPGECSGRCREIYLYDAETGRIVCASCNPTGARPVGLADFGGGASGRSANAYRRRNLLENGLLFFESNDALVPHALGGAGNVYEYESGHVYALSDVAGNSRSQLLDVSANGENVFFGTTDQLLPEDKSQNAVVWDARVDGGFPVKVPAAPCTNGDACKPPPTPQPAVLGPPASATYSGPGNLKPSPPPPPRPKTQAQLRAEKLTKALKACHRDKKKHKRQACERAAHRAYGARKASQSKSTKNANNYRRPGR